MLSRTKYDVVEGAIGTSDDSPKLRQQQWGSLNLANAGAGNYGHLYPPPLLRDLRRRVSSGPF